MTLVGRCVLTESSHGSYVTVAAVGDDLPCGQSGVRYRWARTRAASAASCLQPPKLMST